MTERLVECVPNFSEGRDMAKIEQILEQMDREPSPETVSWSNYCCFLRSVSWPPPCWSMALALS